MRLRPLLLMSTTGGALLAWAGVAAGEGRTFTWTGLDNGTSYGKAGNWNTVHVPSAPMFDDDGNPLFEQIPVLDENGDPAVDDDGNELFENAPSLDADGEPVFDEDGNPVFIPLLSEERWVQGPPDGLDNMLLVSGTPNISANGWHVNNVDVSGGEFIIRTGTIAVLPGQYFVDGIMSIGGTGTLTISSDSKGRNVVQARQVNITGGTAQGPGILRVTGYSTATNVQEPGIGVTQSGGLVTGLLVETPSYEMSGGSLATAVNFQTLFALSGTGAVTVTSHLTGGPGSVMTQSGGTMGGTVDGVDLFTQSGGLLSGTIRVQTYELAGTDATSTGGTITASQAFNLAPQSGTAIVDALLSGDGGIIKSGDSTVVLTNAGNSFTGGVAIQAGTLDVLNDALADGAAVTIDPDAILKLTTTTNTVYTGPMTGIQGDLVKAGAAAATLTGNVDLGDLWINAGRLNIGTGTSTNEAVFDSATVAWGATLYIAKNATLTIRKPEHLVNNGNLINDGTVHDDLDNTGTFANNQVYNANVATNTGTINNNTPGVWTGNITTNAGTINNNAGSTWQGDVQANAGMISNSGTWVGNVLTNVGYIRNYGSWTGRIDMNTYKDIYNSGAGAVWTGDVINNTQIVNQSGAHWNGKVNGNNNVVFNMAGSFWNGNVVANGGGSNSLAQIDNYGTWTGDVVTNDDMIFNIDGTWIGDVLSNSDAILNNHNDTNTNPIGGNLAVWDGDVVANSGLIRNDRAGIWTGDVVSNAGTIVNRTGASWTGAVLANAGTISTVGTWTGDFTSAGTVYAQNQIVGAFTNSGLMRLTGSLAGITTLNNTGTVDLTGAGALQTLSAASATFGGASLLKLDVNITGQSDKIAIAGAATLGGSVYLSGTQASGMADFTTPYEFLSAGSRTGTFTGVTADLAFLNPTLTYNSTSAFVTLARNAQTFTAVGTTENQKGVAGSIEALGVGNEIYDAVLFLSQAEAQSAFDQLSGEAYASVETAFIESAGMIGAIGMNRVAQLFGGVDDDDNAASGYAGSAALEVRPSSDKGFWTQFYGAVGIVAASQSASAVDSSIGGVALGLDGELDDWRLGIMFHAGITTTSVATLSSVSTSTDYGIGVYGGRQWGATSLALGAVYTRHAIRATRSASFSGFTDNLSAAYEAGTAQATAELSQEFDLGAVSLTPYIALAHVNHMTDGFVEAGGGAALTSMASVVNATFATLGISADQQFVVGDDMLLTATASLGWRHTFADSPNASHALAGGTGFSVVGSPIVSDMVVFSAALNLDVSATTTLDVTYDGQIGAGTQTHALHGTWARAF